jgi:hypothetical protein
MEKLSEQELAAIIDRGWSSFPSDFWPVWRHIKSGNDYTIEELVLRESDLELLVIYRKPHRLGGTPIIKFARPLQEFLEKFKQCHKT